MLYYNKFISILRMVVNIDNINGNKKAIAGKEKIKVTFPQYLSWIVMFLS